MARDKVLSLISLATKAGRCASGEFLTESETKSGRAGLVVVAEDASENTKKKFRDMCEFYEVPIYFYKDKDIKKIVQEVIKKALEERKDGCCSLYFFWILEC